VNRPATRSTASSTAVAYRIPALLLVVVFAAALIALDRAGSSPSPVTRFASARAIDTPTVPPPDAISVAWYCAEGTSTRDGRATETVIIANLALRPIDATITVMHGADKRPVVEKRHIDALAQERVPIADLIETKEPGVIVEIRGGPAIVEHELRGRDDIAVGACSREPSRHWYFAEGTTARGAEEWLTLFNPFGEDAIVDVSFLTTSGFDAPAATQGVPVPRRSRLSIPIHEQVLREDRLAIRVDTRVGRVVAERSLLFDGTEGTTGLAVSLGATDSASRWRMPVGDAQSGATQTIAIANFSQSASTVNVGVVIDGSSAVQSETVNVPGRQVANVDLSDRVTTGAQYSVNVKVQHGAPVVAEAFTSYVAPAPTPGVGTALGSVTTAKRWAFAAGRVGDVTDAGDTLLTAVNMSNRPLTVQLYAYTAGDVNSPKSAPARAVGPGERAVFSLRDIGIEPDQVLVVAADGPIVAARIILNQGVSISSGIPDLNS